MGAPGVYITAKTAQAEQGRIRTDIGALLGYAQKGPTTVAVAISSFVQFAQVFGDERSGYLTGSAQSFFDNGGTDLYVIRVNSKTGMTASVSLPMLNEDQCQHRFSCYAAAPAYTGPGNAKQMKAVRKYDTVDVVGTQRFYRMKSPGLWGNDLSINVTLSAPGVYKVVQWEPARSVLRLSSVANLEAGSLLDIEPLLTDTINQWSRVVSVDKASKEVTLTQDSVDRIDHEKAAQSLTIYSTVLRLRVYYKQQLVEEFQRLGLHPDHRRYFVELVNQTSDWLAFESLLEKSTEANITTKEDWQWLNCLQGDYPLKDGLGQLAGIGQSDFAAAIDAVELEPAIGLLAAPDIVYRQTGEVQQSPAIIEDDTCTYPPIHPKGDMIGTVLNQLDDSPIINARAIIATSSTPGLTLERRCDNNGQFTVIGVPIGTATVSIEASGYVFEDFVVTIEGQPFTANGEFSMTPIEQPPVFDNEQILFLQQRLIEQAETLRRHYVLLDPPASESQLSELTDWRYQYDSRLASLIYPWLTFDALEQDREQPSSALVMGALAATDRKKGIMYATANLKMITNGQLAHRLSSAEHQSLNDAHINCLILKPGENIALMGARTLSFDRQWRYISASRLVLYVVQYLSQKMQWAAFEPNNIMLRISIVTKLNGLLSQLWRKGALRGANASEAYSIICDQSNNPIGTDDAGQLVADIGLAIVEPSEFIWLTYQRQTDQSNVGVA